MYTCMILLYVCIYMHACIYLVQRRRRYMETTFQAFMFEVHDSSSHTSARTNVAWGARLIVYKNEGLDISISSVIYVLKEQQLHMSYYTNLFYLPHRLEI